MPNVTFHFSPQFQSLQVILEKELAPYLKVNDHVILSSGTTGKVKGFIISEKALLENAQAVNNYYKLNSSDVWGQSLPEYHIGGLSIFFRAKLTQSKLINLRPWSPQTFAEDLKDVTITSLVPSQLYDLVKRKILLPKSLKHLIIGGDFLPRSLFDEAKALSYPLRLSFGMSEVCSHLGVKNDYDAGFDVLPLHQIKTNDQQVLMVKSKSLIKAKFEMINNKIEIALISQDDYLEMDDLVKIENNQFFPLGRRDLKFKSSGHLFSWNDCYEILKNHFYHLGLYEEVEAYLISDERMGYKIIVETSSNHSKINTKELSELIAPQKVHEIKIVTKIRRTELGKAKK